MIKIKNKIFNGTKAQAAMEFLTTYGWAILILIIVIVALANLGVFRAPSTPNTCIVSAPFACSDIIVRTFANPVGSSWSTHNLTLKANNVGSFSVAAFRISSGTCTGAALNTTVVAGVSTFNGNGDNIIGLACPAANAGNKEVGEIDFTYALSGGGATHTTTLKYSATRE